MSYLTASFEYCYMLISIKYFFTRPWSEYACLFYNQAAEIHSHYTVLCDDRLLPLAWLEEGHHDGCPITTSGPDPQGKNHHSIAWLVQLGYFSSQIHMDDKILRSQIHQVVYYPDWNSEIKISAVSISSKMKRPIITSSTYIWSIISSCKVYGFSSFLGDIRYLDAFRVSGSSGKYVFFYVPGYRARIALSNRQICEINKNKIIIDIK